MISKKALMVGLVGLVFAVSGTATVLQSFGTISGTADVKPSLEFVELQATNNSGEYVLIENVASQEVEVSRIGIYDGSNSDSLSTANESGAVGPGQYMLIVTDTATVQDYSGSKEYIKASTGDSGITNSLADGGENLRLEIDANKINNFSFDGDCSESDVETPSGCDTPNFEVNDE